MNRTVDIPGLAKTAKMRIKNRLRHIECTGRRKMYLTFDDGPSHNFTPQLLDLLKRYQIKASFFVVAEFAGENPEIIRRMKEEGHLIGLHSLRHRFPALQDPEETIEEMKKALQIMDRLGVEINYYRPPWGTVNRTLSRQLELRCLKLVLWDVMAEDWRGNTTTAVIAGKLHRRVSEGKIICLHDGRGKNDAPARTIAALELMLPYWKSQGYIFAGVDELYEEEQR